MIWCGYDVGTERMEEGEREGWTQINGKLLDVLFFFSLLQGLYNRAERLSPRNDSTANDTKTLDSLFLFLKQTLKKPICNLSKSIRH